MFKINARECITNKCMQYSSNVKISLSWYFIWTFIWAQNSVRSLNIMNICFNMRDHYLYRNEMLVSKIMLSYWNQNQVKYIFTTISFDIRFYSNAITSNDEWNEMKQSFRNISQHICEWQNINNWLLCIWAAAVAAAHNNIHLRFKRGVQIFLYWLYMICFPLKISSCFFLLIPFPLPLCTPRSLSTSKKSLFRLLYMWACDREPHRSL